MGGEYDEGELWVQRGAKETADLQPTGSRPAGNLKRLQKGCREESLHVCLTQTFPLDVLFGLKQSL